LALFCRRVLAGLLIPLIFLPAAIAAAEPAGGNESIQLTPQERQWLAAHPVIRVAPDPDFQPIESINENGQLVGISADYLKLLEQKLGIRFEMVPVSDWDDAISKAKSREADMYSAATKSAARSKYMLFTSPHIELPGVIIVRSDAGDYSSLDQLNGKKVGVVSGYVWQEWITRDHPGIDLRPVQDVRSGLLLVSFGELDAMVGNLATATHFLRKLGITNLGVTGETGYYARLALGSRNDWPILNTVLQKAVSSIRPAENQVINDKWIGLETAEGLDRGTILFGALFVIVVVAAAVIGNLLWNYSLRRMVRRQNETLSESEKRFRAIVEDQTEFIGRSLPGVHTLTFVNEAYCRYFDKTYDEMIGTSLMDHIPGEDREDVDRTLATLSPDNPVVQIEHRVIMANGDLRWHRWSDRAIFDASGDIVEIQAVGRDITESKHADDVLRDNEERYRLLIEASPDALLVTSTDGKVLFASSTAVDLFGADSAAQLIGLDMIEFVHPDHRDDVNARRRNILDEGVLPFAERKRLRLDGAEFFSESRGIPFEWNNAPAILIIIRDITDRKLAEAQLQRAQKMEAVGQLTSGVAHDFNNLLTVILGNSETLKQRLGDGIEGRPADAVIRAAKRGAELTHRLLAFSRQQPLSPKHIHLDSLVAGMTDMLSRTLGEATEIETTGGADLWTVEVDPGQLENALLNLAINARDSMPDGGSLRLETANSHIDEDGAAAEPSVSPGDYVTLSVADTGAGMAPNVLERVFEPFFSTKEVGKGSGLGLSMVYGFVAQSGGRVEIDSEEGRGTKVTMFLPRGREPDRAKVVGEANDLPTSRGETLLLVEDEADVRTLIAAMLDDLGYEALEAATATEAIAVFENAPRVDLVVTDIVMPGGMSGLDLISSLESRHSDVRALFISGYPNMVEPRDGAPNRGINVLNKPFNKQDLAQNVREALDRSPGGGRAATAK